MINILDLDVVFAVQIQFFFCVLLWDLQSSWRYTFVGALAISEAFDIVNFDRLLQMPSD
jgi:hypothetical protein